jgi:predicted phosphodiesterase
MAGFDEATRRSNSITGRSLRIGHIADPHIGALSFQNFKGAIDSLQLLADVIVVSGDITANGQVKDFQKFVTAFEGVKIPYIIVAGNHDVMIRGYDNWNQVMGSTENFIDVRNYRIIGFDTLNINWKFLDQVLTTTSELGKIPIMVGHFPIFPRINKATPKFMSEKEHLIERFKQFKVPIYIFGHEHADYLEYDSITFYSTTQIPPNFQLVFMEDRELKEVLRGKMTPMKIKVLDKKVVQVKDETEGFWNSLLSGMKNLIGRK